MLKSIYTKNGILKNGTIDIAKFTLDITTDMNIPKLVLAQNVKIQIPFKIKNFFNK